MYVGPSDCRFDIVLSLYHSGDCNTFRKLAWTRHNFLCGHCLWYQLLFTSWDSHEETAHLSINRRHLSCFLLCPEWACVSFPHQSFKQHTRDCQRKPAVLNWMAVAHIIWMTPLLGQSSSIILWGPLEASCPLCPKYRICAYLTFRTLKWKGLKVWFTPGP